MNDSAMGKRSKGRSCLLGKEAVKPVDETGVSNLAFSNVLRRQRENDQAVLLELPQVSV